MAKNILICDDAAFMRMMIKDILTKNGYNIAGEAENGAKAVEKYAELKPDLVLMDITMPEMDGIQALKKIRESDPNAAIIMCSAMGQQAMVIESIQSGAKDFIVKPFQADRVIEAVQEGCRIMTMLAIGSSRLEAFAQLITLVLIFAFVLALTYFATKWVGNYQKEKMSGSNITVLETMKISGTKYLQIIKIGTKCFAIAVCKDTITYLCEVNEEDLIYRENNSSKLKSENFNAILEKFKKDKPQD